MPTAFITGGTRGIGLAIANRFAKDGCDLGLIYAQDTESAERAAQDLRARYERKVAIHAADVSDLAAATAAVGALEKEVGRCDILVNNAGIIKDALFLFSDPAQNERVVDVHLYGAMHMTRATLKGMISKRGGNIINIISPSAYRGRPGQAAYSAAKGALLSFTKTLAAEVGGFGIRVNALLPGIIETDMTAGLPEEVRRKLLERVSMARFGKPEEVAAAAALLLRANYMHASVLCVDGGLM